MFNVWNTRVFESENYQNDWAGTNHTQIYFGDGRLPEGTYYYIFDLGNGKKPLKGHKVSHANNKTKRRFLPNLKKVKFKSDILSSGFALTYSGTVSVMSPSISSTSATSLARTRIGCGRRVRRRVICTSLPRKRAFNGPWRRRRLTSRLLESSCGRYCTLAAGPIARRSATHTQRRGLRTRAHRIPAAGCHSENLCHPRSRADTDFVTSGEAELAVELSTGIQREQVIAAADMLVIDENLRHRMSAIGPFKHFIPPIGRRVHIDFDKFHTLLRQ